MYFSIKAPMTFSWSSTEREKQMVLRARRLIRVLRGRLLRSMRWVKILPVRCFSFDEWFEQYLPAMPVIQCCSADQCVAVHSQSVIAEFRLTVWIPVLSPAITIASIRPLIIFEPARVMLSVASPLKPFNTLPFWAKIAVEALLELLLP